MTEEEIKPKVVENNEDTTEKSLLLFSNDKEVNVDLALEIPDRDEVREGKKKRGEDLSSSSFSDELVIADLSNGGSSFISHDEKNYEDNNKKQEEETLEGEILNFVGGERSEEVKSVGPEPVGIVVTEVVERDKLKEPEIVGMFGAVEVTERAKLVGTVGIVRGVEVGAKPTETEGLDMVDNIVMRKLLRGPRYFDPQNNNWSTHACYNCGGEGHTAVSCRAKRRRKPCYICGSIRHAPRHCKQGRVCYVCNKAGHCAKRCPDRHQGGSPSSSICLRCGDPGHTLFSCTGDYAPEDLKDIECYICKSPGHLCCVEFIATGRREVSCYHCGQSGHNGLDCPKQRGDTSTSKSPTLCFKCGEEGHFARECMNYSKPDWKMGEFSTPVQRFTREVEDPNGVKSLPDDIRKPHKKGIEYDEVGLGSHDPCVVEATSLVDE